MRTLVYTIAVLALACVGSGSVAAHSGGLDKNGCHHDRKGGTGYHCHRPQNANAAVAASALNRSADQQQPFANCREARAAGAAPVRRGDPGYGAHLDRDGDGVGCE